MISKNLDSTQNLLDVGQGSVPRIARQWENLVSCPLHLGNPLSNEPLTVLKLNLTTTTTTGKRTKGKQNAGGFAKYFSVGGLSVQPALRLWAKGCYPGLAS